MNKKTLTLAALAILALAPPTSVFADYAAGRAAFEAKDYQTAAQQFQEVVDQQPEEYAGHYMLGQSLLKLKRMQDALPHLRKAYDLNPNDLGVQMILGQAYMSSRRYADGITVLGRIDASKLPGQHRVGLHQLLAKAYEKTGDERRYRGQLKAAADADPQNANLQYAYGTAAFNANDTDGAITALAKAASLAPSNASIQKAYAQALQHKGRTSSGNSKLDAYRKASAALAKVVAADASYDNLIALAGAQIGAKQFDGTLTTADRAAAKNANDWLPLYYKGQAYTQKGQFRSAEEALNQALNKATSSADKVTVYSQLGYVYEKQKRYDNAIAAYNSAGNRAGVARAEKNKETEEFNKDVDKEAQEIAAMEAERKRLEEELKNMTPGARPPTP